MADGPTGVPFLLDLADRPVVVVGAGPVAAAKLRSLRTGGAVITVVAPRAVDEISGAAAAGALRWEARAYRSGDLDGALLAVAATASSSVNAAVAADAAAAATLCVRVDAAPDVPPSARATAAFMGAVRRGPLTIAVASGVPALSRRLRSELAETYGEAHGELAALLAELRTDARVQRVLASHGDEARAALWRRILDTDILDLIGSGRIDLAKEVALACLSSSTD
jgi:siroheme synthase-like protein